MTGAARAVIADRACWTSFSAAQTAGGEVCDPLCRRAARWDGLSAVRVAARAARGDGEAGDEARAMLDRAAPGGDYFAWERRLGRRHAEVLGVFDEAVALAAELEP